MDTKQEKCENCLYVIIIGFFIGFVSLALPMLGADTSRFLVGILMFVTAIVGTFVCLQRAYLLGVGGRKLGRRLRMVYVMTAFTFICAAVGGISSSFSLSIEVWDRLFQFRWLSLLLELVALCRLFVVWDKDTKDE